MQKRDFAPLVSCAQRLAQWPVMCPSGRTIRLICGAAGSCAFFIAQGNGDIGLGKDLTPLNGNLKKYGLTSPFEQEAALYEGLFLARVSEQRRDLYRVICEQGELGAGICGKLAYRADDPADYPAVGDWVMIDRQTESAGPAVIRHVLPRKSILSRQAAGKANARQAIAANIDTIFICMSLNADFNLRRAERYLTIAWDSGAAPVMVLTKADLCDDPEQKLQALSGVAMGAEVLVCSAQNEGGFQVVAARIGQAETVAFVGSSGVGKSTLINRLMGQDILATKDIRQGDDKGKHTTSHRQLLLLPKGGIVIDTPGMRELQIYTGDLSKAFADIEALAAACKYGDCSHGSEPGCMVRKAMAEGALSAERFESYQKLKREISYDGLTSRQLEEEKINRMFGGKAEMKQLRRGLKEKGGR